jgi:hypothetical protein
MERILSGVGSMLCGMRVTMLFFYVGLVAIISISGMHALKTYLSTFVLSAIGILFAERLTREKT